MKKKIGIIKLKILSGKATPAPPIGSTLGQKGLNIMDFCKKFNSQTQNLTPSVILPVLINFYFDKTYDFIIKKPTLSNLLKTLVSIDKFSSKPKLVNNLFISIDKIKNLAFYKISDFNTNNLYNSIKIILGTLKSLGIDFA